MLWLPIILNNLSCADGMLSLLVTRYLVFYREHYRAIIDRTKRQQRTASSAFSA